MGGQQLIETNLEDIKFLPSWAQILANKYQSKTVNMYLIYGNIRDFLPHSIKEGEFRFTKVQEYIPEVLFGNKDIIAYYDRSRGITFCTGEMEKEYLSIMQKFYPDTKKEDLLSKNPEKSFIYLENYFFINIPKKKRLVFLIDYAETIVPNDEIGDLDEIDRFCLVTLNRWSHDPIFTNNDVSVMLLSENLCDINKRIVNSPSIVKVEIPLPDEEIRTMFCNYLYNQNLFTLAFGVDCKKMGSLSSGLNLWHLHQIITESYTMGQTITLDYLRDKKREILENEGAGLIEFIETDYNLDLVSGHEFVKNRFKNAARAIKHNQLDVLPMGYLISGPIGTGKSFLVSAFAGEIGIPMVIIRNIHGQQNGFTESNLEKVLSILKAISPVAVMIDEADAMLGSREDKSTNSESSRIFAQIANFMGNTEYRGKIIWFLITSRPDLIPIDLKRQGRAEEHLALFYPETVEEKVNLFETMKQKLHIKVEDFNVSTIFKSINFDISGADIEAILVRAKMNAAMDNRIKVTQEDLKQTIKDFIPPVYPYEIELQNLVAILECTSKEMIPKRYQNMERAKLASEIRELKQLLNIK